MPKTKSDLTYTLPDHITVLEKYIEMIFEHDLGTSIDDCLRFAVHEYYKQRYLLENIICAAERQDDLAIHLAQAKMYLKEISEYAEFSLP